VRPHRRGPAGSRRGLPARVRPGHAHLAV